MDRVLYVAFDTEFTNLPDRVGYAMQRIIQLGLTVLSTHVVQYGEEAQLEGRVRPGAVSFLYIYYQIPSGHWLQQDLDSGKVTVGEINAMWTTNVQGATESHSTGFRDRIMTNPTRRG